MLDFKANPNSISAGAPPQTPLGELTALPHRQGRDKQGIAPGGGETICPPPMAVRLAADLRPSADGSAVHTWLSCRQPACLQPRAAARLGQLRHGTDRRTDCGMLLTFILIIISIPSILTLSFPA